MTQFRVDFNRLKDEFKREESINSSGGNVLKQKHIPENGSIDIRILPPLLELNGNYYLKVTTVWVNNKPYVSPRTFDLDCPILDAYDQIMNSNDAELKAIIGNDKIFNVSHIYQCPILLVDIGENGEVQIKGEPKIFAFTWQIYKGFNNIISNRRYQRTQLGIFDFDKGYNLIVSREVRNGRTNYSVFPDAEYTSIPEKYRNNIPNVFKANYDRMYGNDYLVSVIENLLYGSRILDDSQKFIGKVPLFEENNESVSRRQTRQKPIQQEPVKQESMHQESVQQKPIQQEPVKQESMHQESVQQKPMTLLEKLKAKRAAERLNK